MIDINATLEIHKNIVSELSRGSQKLVAAVCDECGMVRDLKFRNYRDLCVQCAQKSPDVRVKKSGSMMGKNLGKKKPPRTAEHTKKQAEAQKGRQKTDDEILNIKRAASLRPPVTDETKDKMSDVRRGVPKSDEAKARMKAHASSTEGSKRRSVHMSERYSTDEGRERQSARLQQQDYDNGDWTGYTDKTRPHLLPIHACTCLNKRFSGSEGHHLSQSLAIFVPVELHQHIDHNLSSGLGMAEMNALALQFAF